MNTNNLNNKEDTDGSDQPKPRWFIDLEWDEQNNRSFYALAQNCLCAKCHKQLKAEKISAPDLMANIQKCCSKNPEFITDKLPILESAFRLFLANGNKPLDSEALGEQLKKWRAGDTYHTSSEILSQLLSGEQYYGLRQVPD